MKDYTKYLKIKDNFDLNKLIDLGFKKIDYTNGDTGYRYKKIQYEIKDYYPVEEDGTRYINNCNVDYNSIISIDAESRRIWIEIFNNDCTYHNEGDEVNFIANVILELSKLNCLENLK